MGQYKLQTDNILGLIIMYIQNTFNIMSNSLLSEKIMSIYKIIIGQDSVYLKNNNMCVRMKNNAQLVILFIGNN